MTKRRELPNHAIRARDEAAEAFTRIIWELDGLVHGQRLDSVEVLRKQSIALKEAHRGLLIMVKLGAKVDSP